MKRSQTSLQSLHGSIKQRYSYFHKFTLYSEVTRPSGSKVTAAFPSFSIFFFLLYKIHLLVSSAECSDACIYIYMVIIKIRACLLSLSIVQGNFLLQPVLLICFSSLPSELDRVREIDDENGMVSQSQDLVSCIDLQCSTCFKFFVRFYWR